MDCRWLFIKVLLRFKSQNREEEQKGSRGVKSKQRKLLLKVLSLCVLGQRRASKILRYFSQHRHPPSTLNQKHFLLPPAFLSPSTASHWQNVVVRWQAEEFGKCNCRLSAQHYRAEEGKLGAGVKENSPGSHRFCLSCLGLGGLPLCNFTCEYEFGIHVRLNIERLWCILIAQGYLKSWWKNGIKRC